MAMTGGSGVTYLFRIDAEHTTAKSLDGTTSATALAHASLKIGGAASRKDILVQTDYTYNDDGTLNIKWSQTKNDATLDAFLEVACPRKLGASSTGVQELVDESGYTIGGDSGSTTDIDFLAISYGAEDSDSKIPVMFSIGNILKTSGSYSMSYNNWNQPTLEFKSKACLNASGYTVPTALLDGTILDIDPAPSAIVIAEDFYSKIVRLLPV